MFNHQLLIYDSDAASSSIFKNKTSLPLRCCYIKNIEELINDSKIDDILGTVWDNWGIKLIEECNDFEMTGKIPPDGGNNTFYVLYDHLYNETERKKAAVIIDKYIKNTKNNFFLECLSTLAQAKLPFFNKLSKNHNGNNNNQNPLGTYNNHLRLETDTKSKIAKIQLLESTLTKIFVIDERIQNALVEKYMGLSYGDLYKMINILIPDKPSEIHLSDHNTKKTIDLSGKCIEKNEFISLLNDYNQYLTQNDFIVMHYSILERVYSNDKHDIDACLREQAKICNVVVTSGRGTPGELPVEVRFINLSSFLYAFLEVRSKHCINYVLNSTRKANRI